MKLSVLPIKLPYESEPIKTALSGKKLLAAVAKGSDDIVFRETSRDFGNKDAGLHIIKCIDKSNNPHYLATFVYELNNEPEFVDFDTAIILAVFKEVQAKDVTQLPDHWVEVTDQLVAGLKGGYRKS